MCRSKLDSVRSYCRLRPPFLRTPFPGVLSQRMQVDGKTFMCDLCHIGRDEVIIEVVAVCEPHVGYKIGGGLFPALAVQLPLRIHNRGSHPRRPFCSVGHRGRLGHERILTNCFLSYCYSKCVEEQLRFPH